MKFKIPSSQIAPHHNESFPTSTELPFSWNWTTSYGAPPMHRPYPRLGQTQLRHYLPSPGLHSPASSAVNQRVPEFTHHWIPMAEHLPWLFPPLTMFSFPIPTDPDGPDFQMPSPPWSPPLSHISLPRASPSTQKKQVPLPSLVPPHDTLCHLMSAKMLLLFAETTTVTWARTASPRQGFIIFKIRREE